MSIVHIPLPLYHRDSVIVIVMSIVHIPLPLYHRDSVVVIVTSIVHIPLPLYHRDSLAVIVMSILHTLVIISSCQRSSCSRTKCLARSTKLSSYCDARTIQPSRRAACAFRSPPTPSAFSSTSMRRRSTSSFSVSSTNFRAAGARQRLHSSNGSNYLFLHWD